jgi:hypothetical protein
MTRVKKNFSGRAPGSFFFTHGRPEQVAPFSILKNFVDYFRLPHFFKTWINKNSQFQFLNTSAAYSGVWNAND